jgi:phosphoenolpyruvate-protein kinase (PTS system EI component)
VPAADFFSIGSNDLSAATLAVERTDPRLSPASVAEPAVLGLVGAVVERAGGRPVSLCGDAAGDPLVLPLLVGAGLRSFSVAPPRLPDVRARLADLDTTACVTAYQTVLAGTTAAVAGGPRRG